jgi:hypothetical protein
MFSPYATVIDIEHVAENSRLGAKFRSLEKSAKFRGKFESSKTMGHGQTSKQGKIGSTFAKKFWHKNFFSRRSI